MPTVSADAITKTTQIYILPPFRNPPKRSRLVLTQKTSKNVQIKRTQIPYTRISLMSAALSKIQMPLVIEILILTQTSLPLLVSMLLYSLIFTIILRETTRKKRLLLILQSYEQILNLPVRRSFLTPNNDWYIIQSLTTIPRFQIVTTLLNCFLTSTVVPVLANHILSILYQLICKLSLEVEIQFSVWY